MATSETGITRGDGKVCSALQQRRAVALCSPLLFDKVRWTLAMTIFSSGSKVSYTIGMFSCVCLKPTITAVMTPAAVRLHQKPSKTVTWSLLVRLPQTSKLACHPEMSESKSPHSLHIFARAAPQSRPKEKNRGRAFRVVSLARTLALHQHALQSDPRTKIRNSSTDLRSFLQSEMYLKPTKQTSASISLPPRLPPRVPEMLFCAI